MLRDRAVPRPAATIALSAPADATGRAAHSGRRRVAARLGDGARGGLPAGRDAHPAGRR